jgi:GxxExxY protein
MWRASAAANASAEDAEGADLSEVNEDPQTYEIIGAAMEVHRQVGHGFLGAVYQEALAVEMAKRNIPFARETAVPVEDTGNRLQCCHRADFICSEDIVVELKAINQLTGVDEARMTNESKAIGFQRGLLRNFGMPSLAYKRLVLNRRESSPSADNLKETNFIGV